MKVAKEVTVEEMQALREAATKVREFMQSRGVHGFIELWGEAYRGSEHENVWMDFTEGKRK